MFLLYIIYWMFFGIVFAITEQLWVKNIQLNIPTILRRSKWGVLILLDIIADHLDRDEVEQGGGSVSFTEENMKHVPSSHFTEMVKEIMAKDDDVDSDINFSACNSYPTQGASSAGFNMSDLVEQAKEKNKETQKKYDDARKIQLAKDCVECDVYLTDFAPKQEEIDDVMNIPVTKIPDDADLDIVEQANHILDENHKGFNSDD